MILLGICAASITLLGIGLWLYFVAAKQRKKKELAKAADKERHDAMMRKALIRLQIEIKEQNQEDMN